MSPPLVLARSVVATIFVGSTSVGCGDHVPAPAAAVAQSFTVGGTIAASSARSSE